MTRVIKKDVGNIRIALDKILFFFSPKVWIFFLFLYENMLWVLGEVLLMSTHKICFCGEIRKIFT